MKNYKKCVNHIRSALMSVLLFIGVYSICWMLNARLETMLFCSLPFVIGANVCWVLFGLHADIVERRKRIAKIMRKRRQSLNYGGNIIYGFFPPQEDKYYLYKIS